MKTVSTHTDSSTRQVAGVSEASSPGARSQGATRVCVSVCVCVMVGQTSNTESQHVFTV